MSFNFFGLQISFSSSNAQTEAEERRAALKKAAKLAEAETAKVKAKKDKEAKDRDLDRKLTRDLAKAQKTFNNTVTSYVTVKREAAQAAAEAEDWLEMVDGLDYAAIVEAAENGASLEDILVGPVTTPRSVTSRSTSRSTAGSTTRSAAAAGSNKTTNPKGKTEGESKTELVEKALKAAGIPDYRINTIVDKSFVGKDKCHKAVDGWANALITKGEADVVAKAAEICVSIPFFAKKWNKWVNADAGADATSTTKTLVDDDAGTSAGAMVDDEPEVELAPDEASPQEDIQSPKRELLNDI